MLGCRSSSVAQPNQTSLMNSPPTKYAAARDEPDPTRRPPTGDELGDEPEGQRHQHEHADPLESEIPLHGSHLLTPGSAAAPTP